MTEYGDDVAKKRFRFQLVFGWIKSSSCVKAEPQIGVVRLYIKIDPKSIVLDEGFNSGVSAVGHYGTGHLELTRREQADWQKPEG